MQLYIEGYLQAMLDTVYKQEYLRVRVVDNQVTWFLFNYVPIVTLEIFARVVVEKLGFTSSIKTTTSQLK